MLRTIALACLFACSNSAPAPAPGSAAATHPMHKDPAAAKQLIAAGATVIDVRSPEEFSGGHVPSATNIPVQDFAGRIAEVDKMVGGDKTKPVVVYCAAGGRAHKAELQLEAAGYTHVVNGGGFDDLR